jgi:hypothetical protein
MSTQIHRVRLSLLCASVAALSILAGAHATRGLKLGAPQVKITRGIVYADKTPTATWTKPVMDIYAPSIGRNMPLVVFLVAHSLETTTFPLYERLASAVAERGVVVAVASWSERANGADTAATAKQGVSRLRVALANAACAVSYAHSKAAEFGASPSRLVLAGQLYGANAASVLSLRRIRTLLPGCRASKVDWTAKGVVGLDGDWLGFAPPLDHFGKSTAEVVAAISPWGMLPAARRIPFALAVTDATVAATRRCNAQNASWMKNRDPSGKIRARLAQANAFADGCLDSADNTRAMALELTARGFKTKILHLTSPISSYEDADAADLSKLTAAIASVARSTKGG